ncbi:hemerythrin-like domain-containing protein [Arthrobacter woluwensis]|uniref:hemerythrin domain-containing protein n=1 Tax=Arthrobacter woluwensis TaxID=156980 RepID=UPI0027831366|nr:hemerythrin domain-containing protein [Arthrobacter woluwensis]MDQ0709754.1 hemerythrin-like domain-containing protein [Arthrobacter woluwensis]
MTDSPRSGEQPEVVRLIAWGDELREVHQRLRKALHLARTSLESSPDDAPVGRDILLFCHGFCAALTGHHQGEDRRLFPAIEEEHPELSGALRKLAEDHVLISQLLEDLEAAVRSADPPERLVSRLDGIGAIMESHFQYEERQLLTILDSLELDARPHEVLGPL